MKKKDKIVISHLLDKSKHLLDKSKHEDFTCSR